MKKDTYVKRQDDGDATKKITMNYVDCYSSKKKKKKAPPISSDKQRQKHLDMETNDGGEKEMREIETSMTCLEACRYLLILRSLIQLGGKD